MNDIIELSELNLDNNDFKETKTSNFGGGLELLMNDRIKDAKPNSDIDLDDLNNLENELNELAQDIPTQSFKSKSDMFNFSSNTMNFDDSNNSFNPLNGVEA